MTEKEKYLAWFKKEQEENGLLYISLFTKAHSDAIESGDILTGTIKPLDTTEEELYGELNRMLAARDIADPLVLGKFSPL